METLLYTLWCWWWLCFVRPRFDFRHTYRSNTNIQHPHRAYNQHWFSIYSTHNISPQSDTLASLSLSIYSCTTGTRSRIRTSRTASEVESWNLNKLAWKSPWTKMTVNLRNCVCTLLTNISNWVIWVTAAHPGNCELESNELLLRNDLILV